jgi:hypothetical protein
VCTARSSGYDKFDTLKHAWLVQFIEHRVADKRIVRLIQKWLSAGPMQCHIRGHRKAFAGVADCGAEAVESVDR